MATRRHGTRVPLVLTDAERKSFIAVVDADVALRADMEFLLKVSWPDLSDAQKVGAIRRYEELGYAKNSIKGAAEGHRGFARIVADERGEIDLVDRVALLEERNRALKETVARQDNEIKTLRARLVEDGAAAAMAVHSKVSR